MPAAYAATIPPMPYIHFLWPHVRSPGRLIPTGLAVVLSSGSKYAGGLQAVRGMTSWAFPLACRLSPNLVLTPTCPAYYALICGRRRAGFWAFCSARFSSSHRARCGRPKRCSSPLFDGSLCMVSLQAGTAPPPRCAMPSWQLIHSHGDSANRSYWGVGFPAIFTLDHKSLCSCRKALHSRSNSIPEQTRAGY